MVQPFKENKGKAWEVLISQCRKIFEFSTVSVWNSQWSTKLQDTTISSVRAVYNTPNSSPKINVDFWRAYSQEKNGKPEERRQREEMQEAADDPAGNPWRHRANAESIYHTQ